MRSILFYTLILVAFSGYAQLDRSKAPQPSPARQIKIGQYQTFTLPNGLQVFVVENHKLPRVQFSIQLKNDPILEGAKAGYIDIAGDLIGTGTRTRNKAKLDEEVDFLGASLNTNANSIFASSLTKHTGKLLDLMTDVLYNPAFSQSELDKLKTQSLSSLAAAKENPNSIASNVRSALLYGNDHPYGEVTTEKSVGTITLEDCMNYYNTYFKPNNAYLIVVGDITFKSAKSLVEKYFIKWEKGVVKNPSYVTPKGPAKTIVAMVDRPNSVQSVVSVAYPVELKPGTQGAIQARVVNQILGGNFSARLMQNLREKHGYTYGAQSQLSSDNLVGSFSATTSVRNAVTDSAVNEMMNELKRISNEPVLARELTAAKASISGAFGRSLENPQTIATFAVNTAKYNLPPDYYNNYLKMIDAVTIDDVKKTAQKYILPENAYILVVGKGQEVSEKLKRFGELKYFDITGQNYIPSKSANLPVGLTAQNVIANYLEAIGGSQKIKELNGIKITAHANVQTNSLSVTILKKAPNKSVTEVSAQGNVLQKTICDGQEVVIIANGQKRELDNKTKEDTFFDAAIIPETNIGQMPIKMNLTGIETVDGQEAYTIEYILPAGGKTTLYFDRLTGYKVQSVKTVETSQGGYSIIKKYQDYRNVNGIRFPYKIDQLQGQVNLVLEVESIEINPTIADSIFKMQ